MTIITLALTISMMTAVPQVMGIRESLLTRIKAIRKAEDSVTICPQQKIKQEEKLSEFRMEVKSMSIFFIIPVFSIIIIFNNIRGGHQLDCHENLQLKTKLLDLTKRT